MPTDDGNSAHHTVRCNGACSHRAQPLRSRPIRPRCSAPSANMRRPSRHSRLRPMRLRRSAAKPSPVPSPKFRSATKCGARRKPSNSKRATAAISAASRPGATNISPARAPSGAMPVTSGVSNATSCGTPRRTTTWSSPMSSPTPSAGISPLKSTLSAAVTGTAAAGIPGRWRPVPCALHEYRDSDPRIRNVAIDIDAGAGASVRMGNYRLGLSAALRVYKQSGSQIQYAHSAGEKGVYHLSGLGRITPGSRAMRTPRPDIVAAATG